MAILIEPQDPSKADRPAQTSSAASERDPLLPAPPPYILPSTSSNRRDDPERGGQDPDGRLLSKRERTGWRAWKTWAGRTLTGLLVLGVVLWVILSMQKRSSRDGDWMHPPSSDPSAPSRPEPFPSGPYSPYKPNPHSFPLYSTKLTFHLPLANVNTRLFFHAYGEDAVGSVAFLDSQTNVRQNKAAFEGGTQTIAGESVKETGMKVMDSSRGDVEVTIQIVFASKAKMQERVRIYKEVDSSTGKVGVYIMTPTQRRREYDVRTDYISFHSSIQLPSGYSSSSSSLGNGPLPIREFDGSATTMSLSLPPHFGTSCRFDRFRWTSCNSPISLTSIDAREVSLRTTNSPITIVPSSPPGILTARSILLASSNAPIQLHSAILRSTHVALITPNGAIARDESENEDSVEDLVLQSSNGPIHGTWSASKVEARTRNSPIGATFLHVNTSVQLETSNAPLTVTISLSPSSHSTTPIPIVARTTNDPLSIWIASSSHARPNICTHTSLSTSNSHLALAYSNFVGSFMLEGEGPYGYGRKPDIKLGEEGDGRKLEWQMKGRNVVEGRVTRDGEGGGDEVRCESRLEGKTTNGKLTAVL